MCRYLMGINKIFPALLIAPNSEKHSEHLQHRTCECRLHVTEILHMADKMAKNTSTKRPEKTHKLSSSIPWTCSSFCSIFWTITTPNKIPKPTFLAVLESYLPWSYIPQSGSKIWDLQWVVRTHPQCTVIGLCTTVVATFVPVTQVRCNDGTVMSSHAMLTPWDHLSLWNTHHGITWTDGSGFKGTYMKL